MFPERIQLRRESLTYGVIRAPEKGDQVVTYVRADLVAVVTVPFVETPPPDDEIYR